jgi:hypothetical protein
MAAHVCRYLVEGITPAACVYSRMCYFWETPEPGLPDQTMAARGAVLPGEGIIFGVDNG